MKLTLERKYKKDNYTIGIMKVNGNKFSDTLEDKDRGLKDTMTETEIDRKKVYGKTAIPTGTYFIEFTKSPKFQSRPWAFKYSGKVLEIKNVKGFSGVRIHPFNIAEESLGCISVGRNLKKGVVVYATDYYYKLVDNFIIPALNRGERVTLTIR